MNALRTLLVLLLLPLIARAGGGPDIPRLPGEPTGDVLRPDRLKRTTLYLGFDAGVHDAQYFGTHVYGVTSPYSPATLWSKFDRGDGLGFVINGVVDVPIAPSFGVVTKLGYVRRTDTFSNTFVNPIFSLDPASGFPAPATLDGSIELTMEFLNIDLLLRYQLAPNSWYLLGGFAVSSLLGNTGTFTQRITSPATVSYADDQALPTGVRSVTMTGIEVKDFTSPRYAVKLGVGTWIPLSRKVFLTPELCADYALNAFLDKPGEPLLFIPKSDVRFMTITLTAGLRFGL